MVVTDRGGHLHDALRLLDQMQVPPQALITTFGPDVDKLREPGGFVCPVYSVPQFFSWIGKTRFFNPFLFLIQLFRSVNFAMKLRPKAVISTGASNVVLFCYAAKWLGADIYHVDNLAQVVNPSIAGRLLYPIATGFYVQWEDLLKAYGPKAQYLGWVL